MEHILQMELKISFDIYQNQPYLKEVDELVLMDLGVHVLDVARFLFGEATSICCRTQKTRSDIAGEDMATMMLGFSEERTAIVECTYGSKQVPDLFPETLVSVEGTNGAITLGAGYQMFKRSGEKVETINAEPSVDDWCEKPWHVVQDSVKNTCRHWIDTVPQNLKPETSVDDNLKTLKLVEAAYQSAAKSLPKQIDLKAGSLNLFYEAGDLRYIKYGDKEIIRRIYVAVRDRNWDTVKPVLSNVKMDIKDDSFIITYTVNNIQSDIDFCWQGKIIGKAIVKI